MKSKVRHSEDCKTLFEIEVSSDAIDKVLDEVYGEMTRVANIPGFRVGKAPKELVRKAHKKEAREEALKRLVREAYLKAVKEHDVTPVTLPDISDVSFDEDKPLLFKAEVETRPKVKLKRYKGLKVEKKPFQVREEDIAKTLETLRSVHARYISVEDRPLKMGDYCICDLSCVVEGKEVHKKREGVWLFIEKESFLPTLTEQMVGMNKSEERDIQAKLPDKYPDEKLRGKDATYKVKIREIKEKVLPNLDDELAKDLGKSDLEAVKKDIRSELEARITHEVRVDMENQLLNQLVDEGAFEVPASFVRRQLELMVEEAKERLLAKGLRREDLDAKNKEFEDKFREQAVRQVRLYFILDEIADLEKIGVSDGELKDAYKAISAQTGQPLEKVKGHYEREDLVDSLENKIREEKTIAFLVENAEVVEKK